MTRVSDGNTTGISPVTIVTHRDTLHTQEECDSALEFASAATGSSRSHTFFVANYCPANPGPDVNTELQIFDILHFAILTAERYVKIAKQQKRNREEDEMQKALENTSIGSPSRIDPNASIEPFFNVLQCKYKWTESTVNKLLSELQDEDIKTMGALAANWTSVSDMFPLGMRNPILKQLTCMGMI
ncbi:hypothetical protein QZH41_014949 [Actinostola sp. cb2023]|nr:hypothetical protein QZH41_014949 [Actinostola sp. cb2023]